MIQTSNVATPGIRRRQNIISNRVFAAMLFIFVEIMFFSALFSSYFVIRRGSDKWDLPGTLQSSIVSAGFNATVLLLSGLFLFLAARAVEKRQDIERARQHILRATVLGAGFVFFQIFMGLQLVSAGFTMKSSIFAACYFLLVGTHGLHALFGVFAMASFYFGMPKRLDLSALRAVLMFWLFVVGVWQVVYAQIYF